MSGLSGLLSMLGGQPQQPGQQTGLLGGDFSSRAHDIMAGMAMGATPQESMSMAGRVMAIRGDQRGKQQQTLARQNQTLQWLQGQGVDANTASYLVSDPAALRTFFAEHNKKDTLSPEAEAQKIRMGQATRPETHITVGGGKFGTIPPGYELREGPEGAIMVPIPGGPHDTSKKDQARADSQLTSSDVITNAATNIRKAISSSTLPATGTVGAVLSNIGETGGAEVARQMAVLKSNATIEALNAMRQQSPTGGALGNVTQEEGAMLAAKAGTLDQKSPNFERDLADYERTLLRTIHGKQAGDSIYEQTRAKTAGGGAHVATTPDRPAIEAEMKRRGLL